MDPLTWALIGGTTGLLSGILSKVQQGQEIRHQQKLHTDQYNLSKKHSDKMFSLQKNEALDNLSVERRNLNKNVGLSFDNFNTALLAQAYGIQDARIQTAASKGSFAAAEAVSGTKGNAANNLVTAYAQQGLDRNIEVQDRQNSDQLNNMVSSANMAAGAISRERASWFPGGSKVLAKKAQDDYNRKVYNLGQNEFDYQVKQLNPFINPYGFLDLISTTASGFASGYGTGVGIKEWNRQKNIPFSTKF